MSSLGLKDCYVGNQAQNLRGILSISHPIRAGVVQDWDDLETIWSHIINTELKTESSAQPLLITQHPLATTEDETKMAEILMEKLEVPAMFIANKSVMSLYGGGNMTGISVDSGHDTTYIGIQSIQSICGVSSELCGENFDVQCKFSIVLIVYKYFQCPPTKGMLSRTPPWY